MASLTKKRILIALSLFIIAFSVTLLFSFSEDKTVSKKSNLNEVLRVVVAGSPHENDYLPFDWKVYEDPSRPEFWADGEDGIMPRPFLKLAGEPTKENAKKLLAWKKKQWEMVEKVIKTLGGAAELELYSNIIGQDFIEFASEKDPLVKLASAQIPANQNLIQSDHGIHWKDLRVVYIYRSTCPHCQSSMPFIKGLKELGAEVAELQIDFENEAPLSPDSEPYNGEWKEYFPLPKGGPTPAFYISYKGYPAFSHIGTLSISQITKHLKQMQGV